MVRQNLGHTADATNSIRARAKTDSRGHAGEGRFFRLSLSKRLWLASSAAKGQRRKKKEERKGRRENGLRTIAEMALQQGIDLSAQGRFGVPWLFRIIS